jgi:hypothetical protein
MPHLLALSASLLRTLAFGCLLAVGVAASAQAAESPLPRTYPTLVLKDGRKLTDVKVINYTAKGILVRHPGGATTLPLAVLPDAVLADLHLSPREAAEPARSVAAADPLAHKAAVALDEIALKPAVDPAALADAPALPPAEASATEADAAVANAPAAEIAPAGEGNIPDFFASQVVVANAAAATTADIVGRMKITLPHGETKLLANVEVRAYPVELLENYLKTAKARAAEAAGRLQVQAEAAAKQGRRAEADALSVQAKRTAAHFVDLIPPAPFAAKTDAHGHFTLRHNLPNVRLVAVGFVEGLGKEGRVEWVGIVPAPELILSESNATTIASAGRRTGFAAR